MGRRNTIILLLVFILSVCADSLAGPAMKQLQRGIAATVSSGSIGTTSDDSGNLLLYAGYTYHDKFTTGVAGNVQYGHVKVANDGSSETLCLALYDSGGNLLLSGSAAVSHSGTQWVNIDMGSSYTLVAATTYYLAVSSQTNMSSGQGVRYDTSGDGYFYDTIAWNCSNDPITVEESSVGSELDLVIYFDNNSGDPT